MEELVDMFLGVETVKAESEKEAVDKTYKQYGEEYPTILSEKEWWDSNTEYGAILIKYEESGE